MCDSNDHKIWKKLLSYSYVDDSWNETEKKFGIELHKNNLNYVRENWQEINTNKIQDMFIISSMKSCLKDTSSFSFLNDKWKIDPMYMNSTGTTCLLYACMDNENLDFIKYLIIPVPDGLNMDICHLDDRDDNCLILACWKNKNLDVIKFLVDKFINNKELKLNINHTDDDGHNCFTAACCKNKNLEIIKYLASCRMIDTNHTDKHGDNCLMLSNI